MPEIITFMNVSIAGHSLFQESSRVRGTENDFKSLFPRMTNHDMYVTRST